MPQTRTTPATPTSQLPPQTVAITREDLPLFCPRDTAAAWSMHPRVYLPIEEAPDHQYTCPYCGTRYVLKEA